MVEVKRSKMAVNRNGKMRTVTRKPQSIRICPMITMICWLLIITFLSLFLVYIACTTLLNCEYYTARYLHHSKANASFVISLT